jgi:hypothetical protein
MECSQFYFFGLTYNVHLDTNGKKPADYIKELVGGSIASEENLYEASQRIALVEDERFFINRQIGTYKEYQGKGSNIQNLLDFTNSRIIDEGINVTLDINNRYAYLVSGNSTNMDNFKDDLLSIYDKIECNLKRWE